MKEPTPDVGESIARAMEIDVRLLPVLSGLLVDLSELGPSPEQIVSAFQAVGMEPGSRVLDLGCGKGTVAVALAERLGLRVEGIDASHPSSSPRGRSRRSGAFPTGAASSRETSEICSGDKGGTTQSSC